MRKAFTSFCLLLALASSAYAQTINNLGSGTTLGGTEQIPMYQGSNPAVTTTPNALKTYIGGSGSYPAIYPSGASAWIAPEGALYFAAGSAVSANTVYCTFGYFGANVTIKAVAADIATGSSGNDFQIGIFSVSGNTLTLVDNTANISTTSTGTLTSPLGNSTDALSVGVLYAFCTNSNGTPAYDAPSLVIPTIARLVAATAAANVVSTSPAVGKSISQTFTSSASASGADWPGTITLSAMADVVTKLPAAIGLEVN